MRDLNLHIGLHKTGTSYLQKLFLENRDLLRAAGLGLGPYQNPNTGSHHAILAAIESEGPEHVFDRVAEVPDERILISVEEMSAVLLDRRQRETIRAAAARYFNPKIVIFLRRQDHLKESVYGQIVKNWFSGDIQADTHYDYDHDRRLADLEQTFGRENVTVSIYRDDAPNDVAGMLLQAVGVAAPRDRLRNVQRQNVSMHRRKVQFLSQVPKDPRGLVDSRYWRVPFFITRVVDRSGAIADDGGRFLMSPAERHELVARHLDGNRAIVARYGIADPGEFVELPDPGEDWQPPAPITRGEVAAVFREALAAAWSGRNPAAALRLSMNLARFLAGTAGNRRAAGAE